jgi:tetratricopeptide (TPR) repeat protein
VRISAIAAQAALLARLRPEEAARPIQRAIRLAEIETHRPVAAIRSLVMANRGLTTAGRLDEAKVVAEAAVALAEKRAPSTAVEGEARAELAGVVLEKGDLPAAKSEYARAIAILEKLAPDSQATASAWNGLGLLAYREGDLAAARANNERALAIQEQRAPGSLDVAKSLSSLGIVAWAEGDLDEATRLLGRALEIREQKTPGAMSVGQARNNLGILAYTRGDLEEARDLYESALGIFEAKAPGSLELARCLSNLGIVHRDQGDLAAARAYYVRALAIKEKQAPDSLDVAGSLNKLGVLAGDQQDFEEARAYHLRALAIFTRLAPGSLSVAWSLNNLGVIARDEGHLAEARDYFLSSLEIKDAQSPGSLDFASTLNNLGDVLARQGDVAAAREHLLHALEIRERQAPGSVEHAETLKDLGNLARRSGDLDTALRYLGQAWDVVRRQRVAVSGDEAQRAFSAYFSAYPADLEDAQLAAGRAEDAFRTREEAQAQALLRILVERGLPERVPDPALWRSYLTAEASFQEAARELGQAGAAVECAERAGRGSAEGGSENTAAARSAREAALATYTGARLEMEARLLDVRRAVPGLDVEQGSLRTARESLPAGSVFLAFSVGKERSVLFVVAPGAAHAVVAHPLPLAEKDLGERVGAIRREIERVSGERAIGGLAEGAGPGPADRVAALGRALFEALFPESLRPELLRTSRWIVSPDGPLWDLPFATLAPGATPGWPGWLGTRVAISYAPSLAVFGFDRTHARPSPSRGRALVVGDPLLASKAAGAAPLRDLLRDTVPAPLPFARIEAVRVARLYGVEPVLGAAATEAAVRAALPGSSVVHLATHGYFHPRLAMSSGILLSPSRSEGERRGSADDGVLQAWELGRALPLVADLVVLSACETGRGERVPGEGLIGLTRSLLGVGARSVVATQWPVADESSADLMVSFHEALRAGLAKDEALRRAMREIAKAKATSHPFYWAGFVLTGDPG